MRHRKKHLRKFGRIGKKRRHLFRNLLESLVIHERIKTTLAKGKDLKKVADRITSIAKNPTLNNFRAILPYVWTTKAAKKLFFEIVPRYL